MKISEQIKEIRLSQKITQKELAKKAGLSRVSIGEIERGNSSPTTSNLNQIAEALGGKLIIYIQEGGENKKHADAQPDIKSESED